ncbi:MFS transporter [Sphingomonas sp. G-3-2-10]|uniref:MFS transporter n=1 Tax=Sphingomonas sp. G-3-2-10 TaxID=2728838 RepID=UPI0019D1612F|nr:MFS transporter [Sphingomonas sp. G-3-2-10]
MTFHHRAVPIVLMAILIDSIGFGIVMPVLPNLIVELSGVTLATAAEIGVGMLASYAAAQFFAGPVVGSLGDSIGRRPVILFSMVAFSIDYALMAIAPTVAWLFLGRVVAGLAGAVYSPANAVLADVTPPDKRGQVYSLMGAAFGGGFILGPAIGGLLADFGPRAPFIAAAVLAGINAVWIIFALPETMTPDRRRPFKWKQAHIVGAFRPLVSESGAARWLILAAFCWQFAHMVYPATWAFWAEIALDWDPKMIGYSLTASGVAMVLVQALITGRAISRFGEENTVVIGMIAAGLVFASFAFTRQGWLVFLLIIPSAFQGFVQPSINALVSRSVDASHQGAVQGGMQSLAAIAAILAPLILGYALAIGTRNGFSGGNFVVAATLAITALIIVLFRVRGKLLRPPVA